MNSPIDSSVFTVSLSIMKFESSCDSSEAQRNGRPAERRISADYG